LSASGRIQTALHDRGLSAADPGARDFARLSCGATEGELEEFFGHGPLLPLVQDEGVTEILVNGPEEIWFERAGVLQRLHSSFSGDEALRRYVRRLLAAQGRKIDQRAPFADAMVEPGFRLHVAAPPVARKGLCLSLRKPALHPWTLDRLVSAGALTQDGVELLRKFVVERKNIFLSGGTGTGKTSFLGALTANVPESERIVALEDIAEIRSLHPHFLCLEARPANQEGEGEISLRRLLREALRMRPDRLIVGECRGSEALDLLLALNTGHGGSMGTIHANSPRDALQRLETLALLAAENVREGALRSLIAGGIHVIVQLERGSRGRRVAVIAELRGLDGGTFLLKETRFS
jgi:pilus assembly protein CpaF